MPIEPSQDYSFESLWISGIPSSIETAIQTAITHEASESPAWRAQIRTQLALTLALQQKFAEAHRSLDEAESLANSVGDTEPAADSFDSDATPIFPPATITHTRIALERGRVFHQAGDLKQAQIYFERAQQLGQKCSASFYVVDALHMLAIVSASHDEKLQWNEQALQFAEADPSERSRRWLGTLWNNKGQWLFECQLYAESLAAYERTLEHRLAENYLPNIRFAQWTLARGYRLLNRFQEAIDVQQTLHRTYEKMQANGAYDFPEPLFPMFYGTVKEELALNYLSLNERGLAKSYAQASLELLKAAPMVEQYEPHRLEKLRSIAQLENEPKC